MEDRARLRRMLRPHGVTAPGCGQCVFFSDCGGSQSAYSLLDCFDLCCCGNGDCQSVCPRKQDFADRLNEVRGFGWSDVGEVRQNGLDLPQYIPTIHHASSRSAPLDWPIVALDTYEVIRLKNGRYETVVDSAEELRAKFRLSANTQVVLRGVADDDPLELYWEYRFVENASEQLRRLDIGAVIGPNFSHFLGVPRTDNLFNRKRQLLCLDELSATGHHTIPHLNAVTPGDWEFWARFLRKNETVPHVAMEFQTGNKNPAEGCKQIDRLATLGDELGRPLHPILVGGTQFLPHVARRFRRFTLIDSTPFMKSMNRQSFVLTDDGWSWQDTYTLERQPLDHLLHSNLENYCTAMQDESHHVGAAV